MSVVVRHAILSNLYKDSVSLMQVAAALRTRDGIEQASCVMATPSNLAQLADAGLAVDVAAAPSDLMIVVRGDAAACDDALAAAREQLLAAPKGDAGRGAAFETPLTSIAAAVEQASDADLALISVPGDYAAAEAMKALVLGLHVMLFSDNVPIADERALKLAARERGLLVMGPDCGTAIVNGVPLGFANVVRRGDIGIVAASGTGLQEVTCRIHHRGGGVSQALGTGGRDLKEEIGGITMLQGLEALANDPATRVIALISKPPAPSIATRIFEAASRAGKPSVIHFLGSPSLPPPPAGEGWGGGRLHAASSLSHTADLAVALASDRESAAVITPSPNDIARIETLATELTAPQHAIRALFTGGTFCYEAQLAFLARKLVCTSNAPAKGALAFDGTFTGHVLLDLGEDEYTRGRPHPMIDPSLRNDMIRAQGADPQVAAILFDVVLGYGAHDDPARDLAAALQAATDRARADGRALALIGHVCGTEGDPQNRASQVEQLRAVGALIAGSNIEAALCAAHLAARTKH